MLLILQEFWSIIRVFLWIHIFHLLMDGASRKVEIFYGSTFECGQKRVANTNQKCSFNLDVEFCPEDYRWVEFTVMSRCSLVVK